MLSRRRWLASLSATFLLAASPAWAGVSIAVPNNSVGAIVSAIAGKDVTIRVEPKLPADTIEIAGRRYPVAARVRQKGEGLARSRFLDDARNASRVGSAIRDALIQALPDRDSHWRESHHRWARAFARKTMRWSQRIAGSKRAGKRLRDDHARVYLLEWAGATVHASGSASPRALAKLPPEPSAAKLEAYERYIESLVASLE